MKIWMDDDIAHYSIEHGPSPYPDVILLDLPLYDLSKVRLQHGDHIAHLR